MPLLPSSLGTNLPTPDVVRAGLPRPRFARIRLDRFQRSGDSKLVEVVFEPALLKAASIYVGALVRESVEALWQHPTQTSSTAIFDDLRKPIREYHAVVVKDARSTNRQERVQLFQLSVLKLLLSQVDRELAVVRGELEEVHGRGDPLRAGHNLRVHHQTVMLSRNAPRLRYEATRHLVRELMRLEHSGMRNLRQSVLGQPWPVPEVMLTNPLLQLDGLGPSREFARHYPLVLHELGLAHTVLGCLFDAVGEWLPEFIEIPERRVSRESAQPVAQCHDGELSRGQLETGHWVRSLIGDAELEDNQSSWIDEPENAAALLGGVQDEWPVAGNWRHPGMSRVQRTLNRRFCARLTRAGLFSKVVAAYEFAAVFPVLGVSEAEGPVMEYLAGEVSRRGLMRRLDATGSVPEPAAVVRRLETLRKEHRGRRAWGKPQIAARLARDVLALRRDLKLGLRAFEAIDSIGLLEDERQQMVSPASQRFSAGGEVEDQLGDLIGHVIVKVDIRGFTELVSEMRRRDLNPTAYLSKYFYDPLELLRAQFDAHKMIVESDALVLAILEYSGQGADCLAVARACSLATALLDLVVNLNKENSDRGLDVLELGVGVAYADEAPTYLYDQSRRVLISPAIGRASRMSSCHVLIRESCPLPRGRGLCVAAPVHGKRATDGREEGLVRYNVNGIEIDDAAFVALNREISLRKLRVREKRQRRPMAYYAGHCPDVNGKMHWIVIREQPIKLWMGRQLLETPDESRSFYEVVAEPRLIERIQTQVMRMGQRRQRRAAVARR